MLALRHLLYLPAVVLAWLLVTNAGEATRLTAAARGLQSLEGSSRLAWRSLLETLSLTLYRGASDYAAQQAGLLAAAARAERAALLAACAMLALAVVQCALLACPPRPAAAMLAWHALLASALAFAVGVSAPLMAVAAHAEVPLLGSVVLDYDSKSLLCVIVRLVTSDDWWLGVVLGVFSVAVPLLKLVLTGLALLPQATGRRRAHAGMLAALGRWSLTDVFVVAVLVAFLAADHARASTAEIGLGLYFFAAYCALSQLATRWLALAAARADQHV